ncbi:MAG: hypothetical protein ABSF44_08700 [Candidatus Bathyarchaeia archaeon]
MSEQDAIYSKILIDAIHVCKNYRPRFGSQKKGYTLEEFKVLYGQDPFYSWMGLDSPLLYSAHKAAGGMTSIYRQIGIGCQELFLRILMDYIGLTKNEATWSYKIKRPDGTSRTLSLDGRIPLSSVKEKAKKETIHNWLLEAGRKLRVQESILSVLNGVVFEVRQGYKSKDSKRQNADIANAAMAYTEGYLPVTLLLSSQIDNDIANRYEEQRWVILRGSINGSPYLSTYAFCKQILGYDLASFFERNSPRFKNEVENVLKLLLSP